MRDILTLMVGLILIPFNLWLIISLIHIPFVSRYRINMYVRYDSSLRDRLLPSTDVMVFTIWKYWKYKEIKTKKSSPKIDIRDQY